MNILKSKRYVRVIIGAMMIMVSLGIKQAQALPIRGAQVYATGGNVIVTTGYSGAGFLQELWLCSPGILSPGPGNGVYIGTNREFGKVVNLGSFAEGTELVFKLYVRDFIYKITPTFFIGPAHRNPDNQYHAQVDFNVPGFARGEAYIEFEDLLDRDPSTPAWDHHYARPGSGEPNYKDFRFKLTNVSSSSSIPTPKPSIPTNVSPDIIPEPSTMCLLGSGLIGLIGYGRKRLFRKDRKV